ncbi:MAG: arsenate reductase ArsC [Desulfomonilaceae bacterium]|nr:arsenate reductase ArsC [Desulfomonilaceae bacterium]
MMTEPSKIRILYLCTGNSCRSQMAEGWTRHLKHDAIDAYSAGTEKRGLDPFAVRVMAEAGVDISGQYSKIIDELDSLDYDYVITVCDKAKESCPYFTGNAVLIHASFDDPPSLAADAGNEQERIGHYRRVRDEIREFVESLPESLMKK